MQKPDEKTHRSPRARDGTLLQNEPQKNVNWYGPSMEPQEEFIDDDMRIARPEGKEKEFNELANQAPRGQRQHS